MPNNAPTSNCINKAVVQARWWVVGACLATAFSVQTSAAETALTWDQAISLALRNHPAAVAAARAEEAAQRAVEKAAAGLLPQVTFSSKPISRGLDPSDSNSPDYDEGEARVSASLASPNGLSGSTAFVHKWEKGNTSTDNLVFSASADLDPAGLRYSTLRVGLITAESALQKATLDRSAQERTVALDTLAAFWRLELDAKRLALAREKAADAEEKYATALKRQELGGIGASDVLSAKIEMLQTAATLRKLDADFAAAQKSFASNLNLTSLPPLAVTGGAQATDLVTAYDQAALEKAAQEHSVAANKRRIDLDIDVLELKQTVANLYPSISLNASYTYGDFTNHSTAKQERLERPWSISLDVQVPLIDGGRRQLGLQDRQADVDNTQTALNRDLEAAVTTLRAKLASWENARSNVEIAQLVLEKARLDETATASQFATGLASSNALQKAQWAVRSAEIDLQAAINEQRLLELDIANLTGMPLQLQQKPLVPPHS